MCVSAHSLFPGLAAGRRDKRKIGARPTCVCGGYRGSGASLPLRRPNLPSRRPVRLPQGDALDRNPDTKRMGFPSGDGLATIRDSEGPGTIAGWHRTPPSTSATSTATSRGTASPRGLPGGVRSLDRGEDRRAGATVREIEREEPADGVVIEGDDLKAPSVRKVDGPSRRPRLENALPWKQQRARSWRTGLFAFFEMGPRRRLGVLGPRRK
jgi:hypothetical protein